jgi:hypothetical protein
VSADFVPYRPKPVLKPGAIYLGDNGRCFCMEHAGMRALYTGRDIDGRRVHRITEADRAYWRKEIGRDPQCEECAAIARART